MVVVMNPGYNQGEKELWKVQLMQWSDNDLCPLEDADARGSLSQGPGAIQNQAGKERNNCHNDNDKSYFFPPFFSFLELKLS